MSRRHARTCPGGGGLPGATAARATWPPCQDTAPKRKGGPATCGPHLQRDPGAARHPGTQDRSASSQRGTPHLRARTPAPASCPLDLRQDSSGIEEPAAHTPTHPLWFTRPGLPSHRSPQLPRLSALTDATGKVPGSPPAHS